MLAAALSAIALAGSPAVPVRGGTAAQRAIVGAALAGVDRGAVPAARIDARHYLVLARPRYRAPSERFGRALWEGEVAAATAVNALAARGEGLAGYEVAGGLLGIPYHGPPAVQTPDLAQIRRVRLAVLARARAAGLAVPVARVLTIAPGALDVTVRLREDQLFDARAAAALTTLFGQGTATAPQPHFLAIETPDGTALGFGGTFQGGGGWSFGGDTGTAPVPRAFPAQLWRARTDVRVQLSGGPAPGRKRTYRIVCDGNLPAQGSRCRRLLADRWSLLMPTPGWTCAGGLSAWSVNVRGVVAGTSVSRDYNGCYAATGLRWARFLGASR